jgi:hypothetical protein
MKKKTIVMVLISALMIIGFSVAGFVADRNCCNDDSLDCCCGDFRHEGMYLDEYMCICSSGGYSFVVRECVYVEFRDMGYWVGAYLD